MPDESMLKYRHTVGEMALGQVPDDIPLGPGVDIAEWGRTIQILKADLARKVREAESLARITEKINAGLVLDVNRPGFSGDHFV